MFARGVARSYTTPAAHPRDQHDGLGDRVLVLGAELVLPLQVPRGRFFFGLRRRCEIELADVAEVVVVVAEREAERAADEGAVLVDHALAGVVEIRAGRLRGPCEERLLLDRRAG